MGITAIAERKLDFGKQLIILGVGIDIKPSGFSCWPSDDKVTKWTRRIDLAQRSGKLSPGEASKLSGALMWATQAIFKRLGRAMLRPIIRQSHSAKSSIGSELDCIEVVARSAEHGFEGRKTLAPGSAADDSHVH